MRLPVWGRRGLLVWAAVLVVGAALFSAGPGAGPAGAQSASATLSPLEIYEGERLTFTFTEPSGTSGDMLVYINRTSYSAVAGDADQGTDFRVYGVSGLDTNDFPTPSENADDTEFYLDIEALADDATEGDETIGLALIRSYNAIPNADTGNNYFTVTIKDGARPAGGTAGVSVSETRLSLTELHDMDAVKSYTVKLDTDPGVDVTVAVASGDDTAVKVDTDLDMKDDQGSLTFTHGSSGNWATPQTVEVRAVNDGDVVGEQDVAISHTASAASGPYNNIAVGSVEVDVTDAGHGVLVFAPATVNVPVGGKVHYLVRLKSAPGGSVTVSPTSSMTSRATVPATGASFNSSSWSEWARLTVTGVAAGSSQVTHAITGSGTAAYPTTMTVASVPVTVSTPSFDVVPAGVSADRFAGGATVEVTLEPQHLSFWDLGGQGFFTRESGSGGGDTQGVDIKGADLARLVLSGGPSGLAIASAELTTCGGVETTCGFGVGGVVARTSLDVTLSCSSCSVTGAETATITVDPKLLRTVSGVSEDHYTAGKYDGAAVAAEVTINPAAVEVPAGWALLPGGLGVGDEFRLLFMTSTTRDASSSDIAVYDTHVQTAAAAGHAAIRSHSGQWRVVGSTASVAARDHTYSSTEVAGHPDVGVWWLNGPKIADDKAGFWSSTWLNWEEADRRTEDGMGSAGSDWHWTGTNTDGTTAGGPLGHSGNAVRGRFKAGDSDTNPISHFSNAVSESHSFYGLSPLYRVVAASGTDPTAQFASATYTATEAAGTGRTVNVAVNLSSAAPAGGLAVGYTVTGTAMADSDYTALSGTVTVPQNMSTANIAVTVLDDMVDDDDETVVLTLSAGSGYTVGTTSVATVTITDDDEAMASVPVLSVTGGAAVTEGGQAGFTIAASPSAGSAVTVMYTVSQSGDFAAAGQTGSKTVMLSGASQAVSVVTAGDMVDEADGSVTVTLNAGTGYTVSSSAGSASVGVSDDDTAGLVTTLSGLGNLAEADGSGSFTVRLATEPTGDVVVVAASTPASVLLEGPDAGSVKSGSESLTFTAANWNTPQTVTVTAVDNDVDDPSTGRTGSVVVSINELATQDDVYDDVAGSSKTFVVLDDDTAALVVSPLQLTVAEAGGTGSFTVRLATEPTGAVVLDVTGAAGLVLVDGPDVSTAFTVSEELAFTTANWSTAQTVRVRGVDNDVDAGMQRQGALTVEVDAAATADAKYDAVAAVGVVVIATDDDTAGVSIVQSSGSTRVHEDGTTTTDSYTVVLDSKPTGDVTVAVAAGAGVQVDGPDAGASFAQSETLTFTASNWNSPQTVDVRGVDDDVDNAGDRRTVSVSNDPASSGDAKYDALATQSVSVRVDDDDTAGVSIVQSGSPAVTRVSEDGTSTTDSYTVVLDSEPTADVTVAVSAGAGVQVDGPDAGASFAASETLTFTPSNWNSAQTVSVRGVDDNVDNPGDRRTVEITNDPASSGDAKYNALATQSVDVRVDDDDAAPTSVTLSVDDSSVDEDGGAATVTVTATVDGATRFGLAQTVTVSVAGTGVAGRVGFAAVTDFTVTIPAGADSGSQSFVLTPHDDNRDETNETVTVSGTAAPSAVTVSSATIALVDDDAAPTAVGLSASSTSVAEPADQTITITATVAGSTTFATAKTVAVSVAGSGIAGRVGFAPVAGFDIEIPAGAATAAGSFQLAVPQNNRDEASEPVIVSGMLSGVTVSPATITLNDNDAAPSGIVLSVDPASVDESAASTSVTVTATVDGSTRYATATAVTVSVAGSGTAGVVPFTSVADFTVTVAAGADSAQQTFTLLVPANAVDHYDETITVSGTAPVDVHGNARAVASAEIALADDDPTSVTMSAPTGDVAEADGTKDVTVALSRVLLAGEQVTVPLSVAGAAVGTDYAFGLHGSNTGVTLDTSDTGSAQDPAIVFAAGAQSAVLRFDPADNDRRTQPYVVVDYYDDDAAVGSGIVVGAQAGGPVAFAITDDETGDIVVPQDWGLLPSPVSAGGEFRLVVLPNILRAATASDIGVYDGFVRGALAFGDDDIRPYAGFFKVLGSVSGTSAVSHNAVSGSGGPSTYWLGSSDRVALHYSQLRGEWANQGSARDEGGDPAVPAASGYFTGSTSAGAASGNPLGSAQVSLGFLGDSGAGRSPLGSTVTAAAGGLRQFLGLSPTFTVASDPTLTIAGGAAVDEGSAVSFTITASPAPSVALTVQALVTDAGGFCSAACGHTMSLTTIPANAATHTFTIGTSGNSTDEADDEISVRLLGGTGYVVGAAELASVTVRDDDPTAVTLDTVPADLSAVAEGATAEFELSLGRPLGDGEKLIATLSFAGTATRGTDYTLACTGTGVACAGLDSGAATVTFTGSSQPGMAAQTATVTVTAAEDETHPESESFDIGVASVAVTAVSGGTTVADDAEAVSITSVAPADIEAQFAQASHTAGEAAGSRTAAVEVTLSGPAPAGGLSVAYTVTGTAMSPDDYATLTGTVSFAQGATTATVMVEVNDDRIDDDAETVVIALSDGAAYDLGTTVEATVTITDDDAKPSAVTLSLNPTQIDESATGQARQVTVTATVDGATRFGAAQTVTVSAARTAGQVGVAAIADFDVTIAAGALSGSAAVAVAPADDAVDEADATVAFTGQLAGVTVAAADLRVADDDATPTAVALSVSPMQIDESATGTARQATVTATVTGGTRFGAAQTVTVTTAVTGQVGVDEIPAFTVTVPAGQLSGSHTVTVVPEADSADETDAVVTFSGTVPDVGDTAVTVTDAVLTVADDDGAPSTIALSVSPTALTEDAGATAVTVTAAIVGTSRFGTDKAVAVTVAGTGAAGVVGFAAQPQSFNVTIPAGMASADDTFTLTPADNATHQDPETVTVSGVLAGVTVTSAVVTLTDDDLPPPVVSFAQSASTASESVTARSIAVTLDRAPGSPLSVSYGVSGTASCPTDCTQPSGAVSFAADATSATVTVAVIDDAVHEDAETVILTLTAGAGYTVGDPAAHVATVVDDDTAPAVPVTVGNSAIPAGLSVGDRFRLLFVTSTTHQAASVDIADYNAAVAARAAAGHGGLSGFASGFRVLASTAAVDARDNTDTNTAVDGTGAAVYWVGSDVKAADDYADLYDRSWDSVAAVDESGAAVDVTSDDATYENGIWTGSFSDGTAAGGLELGSVMVRLADLPCTSSVCSPLGRGDNGDRNALNARRLYGVSPLLEVAAAEAGAATVVPAGWALKPSGLGPGDEFRLLFVTSTTQAATASGVGGYDTIVQTRAAAGDTAIRPYAAGFRVLGSTAAVDARDHTNSTGTGVPVYWLGGVTEPKVADDYTDFYDGTWDSYQATTESGTTVSILTSTGNYGSAVWTGTNNDGTAAAGHELGAATVQAGSEGGDGPLAFDATAAGRRASTEQHRLYAMSELFRVQPAAADQPVASDWALIPSGLTVGDRFRLMFTTSTKTAADHAAIGGYNTFVQARAAAGHTDIRAHSARFRALASTAATDARDNTLTTGTDGEAVYWLGSGAKVADDYSDLYDGSWDNAQSTHEQGTRHNIDSCVTWGTAVWTGSKDDGTGDDGNELGNSSARLACLLTNPGAAWRKPLTFDLLPNGTRPNSETHYLYALSLPFVVTAGTTPPPTDPVLTVTAGTAITEGAQAGFTIAASPSAATAVTVSYTVTQSGAYVASGSLNAKTVSLSGASATVSVATVADDIDEANGSVTVTLNNGTGYTVGTAATATVAVSDDDTAAVVIAQSGGTTAVAEPSGTDTYTVVLATEPTGSVTVTITAEPAVLIDGPDPSAAFTSTETLPFSPANWDTPQTVTVRAVNDDIDNPSNQRTAAIVHDTASTLDTSYNALPDQTVTVTVADDDGPPPTDPVLTVTAGTAVTEGQPARFTVNASPSAATSVTVMYTITQNGAYVTSANRGMKQTTLTGASATIDVATVADQVDEANGTVTVTLNTGTGYTLGSAAAAAVNVSDDDTAAVAIAQSGGNTAVSEPASTDTWTVALATQPTGDVTVAVTASPASAALIDGPDSSSAFTSTETLTFTPANWNSAQTVTVRAVNDDVDNPSNRRTAAVVHDTASTADSIYDNLADRTVTVTVADDDGPPGTPELTITGGTAVTEGQPARFTINASPAAATSVTVMYTITQSGAYVTSANRGMKQTSLTGASATIDVPTVDDRADEPDGSVTVTLNGGTGYTLGTPATDNVRIADNDPTNPPPPPAATATATATSTPATTATTATATPATPATTASRAGRRRWRRWRASSPASC